MNLSDLVHRTAGDNKVLTTSTNATALAKAAAAAANGTSQTNTNLFQQSSSLNNNVAAAAAAAAAANNVFLARQDPSSFLFNMPNMNQTEWINNNLFFNNTDSLIVDPNNTSMLPSNNLDSNSFSKGETTFTTTQRPIPSPQQQQPLLQQQQRAYQPPTIAPYPTQTLYNNRFDIPQQQQQHTTINAPTMRATKSSPNMNIMSKPFNNFNNASVTALSSQVSPIIQFNKPTTVVNTSKQSPNKQNSPITINNLNTPSSVSSPSNLQFSDIVHSSPASTSTSLSPSPSVPPAKIAPTTNTTTTTTNTIAAPVIVKKPPNVPKLTITGDNVNANNIEEGYVQFVLNHDPHYISDGIESLVYAKRKFLSVPKTGDISYTTWDIYELVLKLHNREIKNWSQLVGQLGLADMAGRPQFAQRVKRWMHRYKIDCYFDYLLGNEFYFNAPNEKYSGCLMMGNYKKKMTREGEEATDSTSNKKQNQQGEEWDEDGFDTVNGNRVPVLLAGSRKRMRDHSQSSQQMIENARQYLKTNHSEESDEEETPAAAMDTDDDTDDEDDETSKNTETNGVEDTDDDEEGDEDEEEQEEEEELEEEEEEEVDEEDELASTSSSPGSPAISKVNSSPKLVSITPPLIKKTFPVVSSTEEPVCTNCTKHEATVSDMKKEIAQLKAYIQTLESTVEQQSTMTAQMNKLLRFKDRTERWRKQLIEDLARGPSLVSEEDDDEDVDDETTDGDA